MATRDIQTGDTIYRVAKPKRGVAPGFVTKALCVRDGKVRYDNMNGKKANGPTKHWVNLRVEAGDTVTPLHDGKGYVVHFGG